MLAADVKWNWNQISDLSDDEPVFLPTSLHYIDLQRGKNMRIGIISSLK